MIRSAAVLKRLRQGCCSFAVACPEGFAVAELMNLHPRSGFDLSNSGSEASGQLYQFAHPAAEGSITVRFG